MGEIIWVNEKYSILKDNIATLIYCLKGFKIVFDSFLTLINVFVFGTNKIRFN